jgi:hypothetical protein
MDRCCRFLGLLYFLMSLIFWCTRHGMGFSTGIDLDDLVDVGEYICGVLSRPTQSKVARAILTKREITSA